VRRRLALLVAAAMTLVLVSLLVPLALLVQRAAAERAVTQAVVEVQSLSVLVATTDRTVLGLSIDRLNASAAHPVTVFLPDGTTVGAAVPRTPAVELAARGGSFSVAEPAGREIVVAVQGLPDGTAVIRTFVPASELSRGVRRAWLILAVLSVVLLTLGVAVADRLGANLVRPMGELARVSHRLASGELDARASASGTREVRAVARALNHLADRIRDLLRQERERVADISHRMRTPLTALRLDAESLRDPDEAARIVAHVAALDRALTGVIEHARRPALPPRPAGSVPVRWADATQVVAARAAFWAVLAEDQGRPMQVTVPDRPRPVGADPAELAACVDALLGNVFAHTPDGSAFAVRLTAQPSGGALLVVDDGGPGIEDVERVRRGVSGAGSTGLGLDIVRRTAAASGGTLSFTRSPLGGARVTVALGPPEPALNPEG
jgi:signal transduction histidine kinase